MEHSEFTPWGFEIIAEAMAWNRFTLDTANQYKEKEAYPPVNLNVTFTKFSVSRLTASFIFENDRFDYLAIHNVKGVALRSGVQGEFLTISSKAGKITILAQKD